MVHGVELVVVQYNVTIGLSYVGVHFSLPAVPSTTQHSWEEMTYLPSQKDPLPNKKETV